MSTRLEYYGSALSTEGIVTFNRDWYLLTIPQSFQDAFLEALRVRGEQVVPSKNIHISIMKNESPSLNQREWGTKFVGEKVEFKYQVQLEKENGYHVWINCYSPRLCEMREYFGLPTLKTTDGIYRVNFHMTIGKLKIALPSNLRPQYRISKQSHIDVETLMQHL